MTDQSHEVFVIVEIAEVHNADGLAAYQAAARSQLAEWGGVVVARGGDAHDGTPPFGPVLVQRWPSKARFLEWQNSPGYQALIEGRRRAANLRITIVPLV